MHPDDWFRSDAWDIEAQELFEAKLARARSSRSQYLRIKGLSLTLASDEVRVEAGRRLLFRVIEEHPNDRLQVAMAHYDLGDSFGRSGRWAEAVAHLRSCLVLEDTVRAFNNAELRLAEVLIADDTTLSLDEAGDLLEIAAGPKGGVLFHSVAWRIAIAWTQLRRRQGDRTGAAQHARAALALLDRNEPQFARHPDVGLIVPDKQTIRELKRLARG